MLLPIRFWFLLTFIHQQVKVIASEFDAKLPDLNTLQDENSYLSNTVPMYKLLTFLYIHTDKLLFKHKQDLDSFNAVWKTNTDQVMSPQSPIFNASSPQSGPASPHTHGLKERSVADALYINYVKDHLENIFELFYQQIDQDTPWQDVEISPDELDLLGVLVCGGETLLIQYKKFNFTYPKWKLQPSQVQAQTKSLSPQRTFETAGRLCKWIKKYLRLNDSLYPPIGQFLLPALALLEQEMIDMDTSDNSDNKFLYREKPILIAGMTKSTVIKRIEDLPNENGTVDLVISACYDTYIYILAPIRNVSLIACTNCKIWLPPNTGICTVERCEGLKLTGICGLLRVNNCLDSTFNVYLPRRSLFTGDNRGIQIGPYNSNYPKLNQHLEMSKFVYFPHTTGYWNNFINFEHEDGLNSLEKDEITLQSPHSFHEISLPIKMDTTNAGLMPFTLPDDFHAVLIQQQAQVEHLRQLVASEELGNSSRKEIENIIQVKFKEWLNISGNNRQILDLVQLEKLRQGRT